MSVRYRTSTSLGDTTVANPGEDYTDTADEYDEAFVLQPVAVRFVLRG